MDFFKKKKKTTPINSRELAKQIKSLEERIESISQEFSLFKERMRKAVTKVSVVRYNPFREIGGNLSFSIVLLDQDDNGVVVTSHYGRDGNRMYSKQIEKGKSEHSLSQEEEKALEQAMGQ
ncbi:DUF4446 family protein [Patescibacteria group bacterium]|nr:DUF4446 family protein [Patescibacteria group bacterium]